MSTAEPQIEAQQRRTLSVDEFHRTPEWLALTDKQKTWVDFFTVQSDGPGATRAAYGDHSSEAYIRMLSDKTENSFRVIAALNRFHGLSDRDAFIKLVERAVEQSDGWAKIRALTLLANLKFDTDNSKPTAEDADAPGVPESPETSTGIRGMKIGDIVLVDGVKHKVTAVDASGRPTDGDPL